jgi:integrase
MLINFRATLNRSTETKLSSLKGFLKRWMLLSYGGIDPAVVKLLDSWRLRGSIKGLAVQTSCPHKGALSDLEYEALQQRLLRAFETDDISLDDFVLVALSMATGRRPSQLGDIKGLDLVVANSSDGLSEFVLKIPRRKQRAGRWRAAMKPFALAPEIGMVVQRLILKNEARLLALWPDLATSIQKNLPLFAGWHALERKAGEPSSTLALLMEEQTFHVTTQMLRERVINAIASLSVPSERTGGSLRVFPQRLRRTIGTRAAREGYGVLVIAELLDQSDTQSAGIYTENVPEHVDAINEAVARQLAPLAQAFAGILVDSEIQAVRGFDSTSRIRAEAGPGVGTCGQYGFCGALSPIACYTCNNFQPWLDGAHEQVLATLRSERARIFEITQDPTIAAINDRTILAVTEVVLRCEGRQAELKEMRQLG